MKKLLLSLCTAAFAAFGIELLPDPYFTKAKFEDAFPPGWKKNVANNGGSSKVIIPDGKTMLRIRVANKSFILRTDKYIPAKPGEKITVSIKVTGDGSFTAAMLLFNKGGKFISSVNHAFRNKGTQTSKQVFTIPQKIKGQVPGRFMLQFVFNRGMFDVHSVSAQDTRSFPQSAALQKEINKADKTDGVVVLPSRTLQVHNLTVPAGVTLRFQAQSKLHFLPGALLTLNGRIDAPLKEIITGDVRFDGLADIGEVYPQWFGARGDDRHDDGPALQMAADLARITRNRKLLIPAGRYRFFQKIRIACNIDSYGTLVLPVEPDYKKESLAHYVKQYPPVKPGGLFIVSDEAAKSLDPEYFYGMKADSFKLPKYAQIPLKNEPGKKIDLMPGGTLRFFSTDFFTARKVNNADHVYEPNDIFEITSPLGAVFPESCFDYIKRNKAPEWSAKKVYKRGDYVKSKGVIYKASYPSGPGVVHKDRFKGSAKVGPVDPAKYAAAHTTVRFPIAYNGGKKDHLMVWRRCTMSVSYTPPQPPLTLNNVAIELIAAKPIKKYTQIKDTLGAFSVTRSNVTINNLRVENMEKFFRFYMLVRNSNCVNLTYNNARVSGANHSSGGYNISNSNVGNVTFNNCISTNCRDSIGGRHGKYVTINGGHYGVIDDHYGKNYYINNVTFHPVEPWVPGFYTPKADHQKWRFTPTCCVRFGGRDITIENCRVYGGNSLLRSRPDTADFGGRIVLRNISLFSEKPFYPLSAGQYPDFDYAHKVLTPSEVVIENISNEGKGPLVFPGSVTPGRWRVRVSGCRNINRIGFYQTDWTFKNCQFTDPVFFPNRNSTFFFSECEFKGKVSGYDEKSFTFAGKNPLQKKR